MDRKELKAQARAAMKGNWKYGIFAIFIVWVVTSVFDVPDDVANSNLGWIWNLLATAFIVGPMGAGVSWFFLEIWDGTTVYYRNIMDFTRHYLKVFLVTFCAYLLTTIGFVFLIVPGIMAWLATSQAIYILKENPQMSAFECLRESNRRMKGEKMNLFLLILSFVPFILAPILVFMLAIMVFSHTILGDVLILLSIAYVTVIGFYLVPYFSTVMGGFYRRIISPWDA